MKQHEVGEKEIPLKTTSKNIQMIKLKLKITIKRAYQHLFIQPKTFKSQRASRRKNALQTVFEN